MQNKTAHSIDDVQVTNDLLTGRAGLNLDVIEPVVPISAYPASISPTRTAGLPLMFTVVEPLEAGWASDWYTSPTRRPADR